MQLSQIEAVVAIADTGSFRKAASLLGRTQPTLTKSIQALEDEINLAVFERTPQGVRLTEGGERLYKRACTVMSDVQALQDEVSQMAGMDGGHIRVGLSPVGGTVIIPRALRQFRKRWPRVNVDLINVMYPESVNMLREAALDMIIGPVPVLETYGMINVEHLLKMGVIVATHKSNPKRHATRLEELLDEQWVVHGSKEGPSSLYAGTFAELNGRLPQSYTNCQALSTTVALIAETPAFCIFSKQLFDTIAPSHGIVPVPIIDDLPKFSLSLCTQKTRPLTPAAAELAGYIRRRTTTLVHAGYSSDIEVE